MAALSPMRARRQHTPGGCARSATAHCRGPRPAGEPAAAQAAAQRARTCRAPAADGSRSGSSSSACDASAAARPACAAAPRAQRRALGSITQAATCWHQSPGSFLARGTVLRYPADEMKMLMIQALAWRPEAGSLKQNKNSHWGRACAAAAARRAPARSSLAPSSCRRSISASSRASTASPAASYAWPQPPAQPPRRRTRTTHALPLVRSIAFAAARASRTASLDPEHTRVRPAASLSSVH